MRVACRRVLSRLLVNIVDGACGGGGEDEGGFRVVAHEGCRVVGRGVVRVALAVGVLLLPWVVLLL